jgi:hypothetical protein
MTGNSSRPWGFFLAHTPCVAPSDYFTLYPEKSMPVVQGAKEDQAEIPPAGLASDKKEQANLTDDLRRRSRQAYFGACPRSFVRSRAELDVALPMTKAMNKSGCVRLKLRAVAAAIMISDIDCIGLARARSKIDQVTEIIGRYSNRVEAKPIARLRKPLLVESVECADNLVLAVFDELTDDQLIVCEKLAQRFRRGPLKMSLVEIPMGMEKSLLPDTSVRCQLLGRVTTSPHCQLDTVAQDKNEHRRTDEKCQEDEDG